MPGSQPGVLGLFTTPAKLLIYDNIIATFCQSVLLDLGKKKKSRFVSCLISGIFLLKLLEFNDFAVDDDCDEVDDPPEPTEEHGDENPNNRFCCIFSLECFDDTIDHPSQVEVEDTENDFQNSG